jgi:hypothetical protein
VVVVKINVVKGVPRYSLAGRYCVRLHSIFYLEYGMWNRYLISCFSAKLGTSETRHIPTPAINKTKKC